MSDDPFDDNSPAKPPIEKAESFKWKTNANTPTPKKEFAFNFEPDTPSSQTVVTIYGDKGSGKTSLALSFPGQIAALSFDRQTVPIWSNTFGSNSRIKCFNALQYYVEDYGEKNAIPAAAANSFKFILELLQRLASKRVIEKNDSGKESVVSDDRPDWIMIDGLEMVIQIAEMVMRHDNNIGVTAGFANINLWKERRFHIRAIHQAAVNAAKRGVIYTTYAEFVEDERQDGQVVKGKKHPKWVDVIMTETQVVLRTTSEREKTGIVRFFVHTDSNKVPNLVPQFKTGKTMDITEKVTKLFE